MPRKGPAPRSVSSFDASASMRPGLLCPGKGPPRLEEIVRPAASMRPGLLCPGKERRLVNDFRRLNRLQ